MSKKKDTKMKKSVKVFKDKDELTEFIWKISDIVIDVDSYFTMLKDLQSEENLKSNKVTDYANHFFLNVRNSFTRTLIIEVNNLFGDRKNDETSLRVILKNICNYITNYADHDPDIVKIDKFLMKSIGKLDSLKIDLQKVIGYRDQVWGHKDMDYLHDPKEYFKQNPLYISELEKFLQTAKEICKEAISLFTETKNMEMEHPGSDELKDLFKELNYYSKYRLRYGTAVLSEFDDED
jgi:AbiU2